MGTDWIEALMRLNTHILEAETRFASQVDILITRARRDQDTIESEGMIVSYQRSLVLLRALRAQLLQDLTSKK